MKIENCKISGLKLITPEVFYDFRGEYVETYNEKIYENVFGVHFVQDDISTSTYRTMRGLHGDKNTWKLVQCLCGSIYVVVVDMRENLPTYLQHESFAINDKNRRQLLVPPGCANGHACLSDVCLFSYKQSTYYEGAETQFTIKWNDERFKIRLPFKDPVLSERDNF